ncbi:MAG TPA: hypothetical protein H9684_10525 [Firmicutes bacterium]|nr:hypothetical protein [Bacillota bacterium]
MEWIKIVYILEGGFLVVLFVGITHRIFRDYIGKPSRMEADLVKKQIEEYNQFSIFGKLGTSARKDYTLLFKSNNKFYKFRVNSVFYDSAIEGQKVKITYKGNRLINFEPV